MHAQPQLDVKKETVQENARPVEMDTDLRQTELVPFVMEMPNYVTEMELPKLSLHAKQIISYKPLLHQQQLNVLFGMECAQTKMPQEFAALVYQATLLVKELALHHGRY